MTNHQWADFRLTDFFHLEKGNQNNMVTLNDGNIPLVSARKCNNGYKQFVSPNNKRLFDGNILTLNNDGDGGAGIAFYQPYRMALDSHVTALIPKIELNRFHLLFMAMCITKQRGSFGHGHSLNSSRLSSFKYMLPITADKQPDWRFMENYMQNKEQELLENYKSYLKRVMPRHKPQKAVLEGKKWKAFNIGEVFPTIQRGKRLKTEDHIIGRTPYVSSSSMLNGVDNFVSNTNGVRRFKNCLTLANSGSVGETFYQPFEFVASDHVTKLENPLFDKYVYLFIATIVKRLSEKYSFNREINDARLHREKILLPVDEKGDPDYGFMSAYMKRLEYDMQWRYLEYIENSNQSFNITNS